MFSFIPCSWTRNVFDVSNSENMLNYSGLMCELLWSDPHPGLGRAASKRGIGVSFGSDVTERFLEENNLGM